MGEADTVGVIEAAYAAAVAPELWPEALGRLARLFRSHFADVFARNADHTSFSGTAIGLDRRDYEDDFLGIWVKRNVWGSKRPVRMAGEVVSTRQMVPKEELLRSEMYQDYLAPRQLDEGLRLAIAVEDGWIHDISLLRPWSAGPFEAAELDLAGALLPHLQRAAAVSRRLGEAAATAQAGAAALEALRHPVFLLDAAGRALQWNHAATRLLERPGGLSLTGAGMLRAVHAGANVALEAAVARAGRAGRPRAMSSNVDLPHGAGGRATLTLLPLGMATDWTLPRPPAILAVQHGPPAGARVPPDQLAALFGLTRAEAELAIDLLAGLAPAQIAARRSRSIHTIRTHLARLMAKTQTRGQGELVRLLASIPAPTETEGGSR